jgi:TetR/AcrR family transcriptional repressor of nem operon
MNQTLSSKPARENARTKLLDTALNLIRAKGYTATTVDELCAAAGVTKGAFFHHFLSKEALAVAAADHWAEKTDGLFASSSYHHHVNPLDRVLGYIDFRLALIEGPVEAFTCLVGTMVQETYATHPPIRDACYASISSHAQKLEADIAAAMADYGVTGTTAGSLALHTQAVLQGGFILAKAKSEPEVARESVAHLKRYFMYLFQHPKTAGET